MSNKKFIILMWVVIIVVILPPVIWLNRPFHIDNTLFFQAPTIAILENLGLPEGATEISDIKFDYQDGTQPEMGERFFRVDMSLAELQEFYRKRCEAIGLSGPDEEYRNIVPAALCGGGGPVGRIDVHIETFDCTDSSCGTSVQVTVFK